jgi:hypothetical protein
MASTLEQQEQDQLHSASTSHDANVSHNTHVEPPSSSQIEDEYHALAAQTANLDLKDQDIDPDVPSKDVDDTWSDEDAPTETTVEKTEPQAAQAIATAPADDVQVDQSKSTEDAKNADHCTASKDVNPETSQDDETITPRFETYVKLHNDVSFTSNKPDLALKDSC